MMTDVDRPLYNSVQQVTLPRRDPVSYQEGFKQLLTVDAYNGEAGAVMKSAVAGAPKRSGKRSGEAQWRGAVVKRSGEAQW